jgi:glycosyltransferase involved in cell wall biosynthesis
VRIVLQVTETLESGLNTGIQRVVRRLVDEIISQAPSRGIDVHLVTAYRQDRSKAVEVSTGILQGHFSESPNLNLVFQSPLYIKAAAVWNNLNRFGFKKILNSPAALRAAEAAVSFIHRKQIRNNQVEFFELKNDDYFVILDSFWGTLEGLDLAKSAKKNGARVAVLINDIFPITHPEYVDEHNIFRFKSLVPAALEIADFLFIPSEVTRSEISSRFYEGEIPIKQLLVVYGSDVSSTHDVKSTKTQRIENSILMIGTVEPRKNHQQVIDWYLANERFNSTFTVIGKAGWLTNKLQKKMLQESNTNPHFRWLDSATDDELIFEMERHEIGIMASFAEGLGLPVLEMESHGLKLVLSDIPIFREVAGSNANYFELGSIESLDNAISLARSRVPKELDKPIRWADTAKQIIDFLENQNSPLA